MDYGGRSSHYTKSRIYAMKTPTVESDLYGGGQTPTIEFDMYSDDKTPTVEFNLDSGNRTPNN